ncbi:hypothetical protein [Nostoc sp.]
MSFQELCDRRNDESSIIRLAIALIFRSTEGDLKGRLTTLKFL